MLKRYSSKRQEKYRKNGFIKVKAATIPFYDKIEYWVYENSEVVCTSFSKYRAIKIAKRLAVDKGLAFNTKADILL